MYEYGACHICGQQLEESRVTQDFWIKGKLVVIEDVPAGVCPQCGEKVVQAGLGRAIAGVVQDTKRLRTERTMRMPVIKFAREVA
jgi:YgiT-type zinc finger domain-containing protein